MKNSIRLQAYASAILLAGLYCQTAGGEERAADLIIVNAVVHTVDEAHPKARWIAIRDGRIEALGNAGPSTALRGPGLASSTRTASWCCRRLSTRIPTPSGAD